MLKEIITYPQTLQKKVVKSWNKKILKTFSHGWWYIRCSRKFWDTQNSSFWWQLLVFGHLHVDIDLLNDVWLLYCKARKIIFFHIKIKVITFFRFWRCHHSSSWKRYDDIEVLFSARVRKWPVFYSAHGTIYSHGYLLG